MSIQLTANEAAVLLTFNTYEDVESTKGDLGVSWTGIDEIAAATGKSLASVKGIIGSLIKKGLVESDEADAFSGKPVAQCLTAAGADALFALRSEEAPLATDEEEEGDEGPATFIPAAVIQAPLDVEGGNAPEAPAQEAPKPAKAKAAPREKLVLTDLDGTEVASRRAPNLDTMALVLDLVGGFGGGVATPFEKLHEAGFDADTLDRIRRRIKSWFGKDRVAQTKEGLVINLRVREEGEAAQTAEAGEIA